MKLAKRILLGAMAAVALVGCKDDKLVGPDDPKTDLDKGPGVYFALQIDLPNARGSRSETTDPGNGPSASTGGVEVGKDYENAVGEAIIVLADANNNEFIAAAQVPAGDLKATSPNKSSYVAKSKFSKSELASYYEILEEKEYKKPEMNFLANIFVFCNPTINLRNKLLGGLDAGTVVEPPKQGSTDWLQYIGSITTPGATISTSTIWAHNSFLMNNALLATRELPATIVQWNAFTEESNPFHLSQSNTLADNSTIDNSSVSNRGAIKVERACARFDFMDGSKNAEGRTNDFTYDVLFLEKDGVPTNTPLVRVQLQKMFLVNQSNSYYYLPRTVAPTNDAGSSIVDVTLEDMLKGICKPEKNWIFDGNGGYIKPYGNYVADYNINWKNEVFTLWTAAMQEGDKDDEDTSGSGGTSTSIASDFDQYFNYPFFNNDGTIDNTDIYANRWSMYLCKDVVAGEKDNREEWSEWDPDYKDSDYRIWCYSTENTIPSIEGQINGISTGVVFKAKFSSPGLPADADANAKAVAAAINNTDKLENNDPIIYMYQKILYCGWENIREAALTAADAQFVFIKTGESLDEETGQMVVEGDWELRYINRTNSLYRAVFGEGGVGVLKFTYTDDADGKEYTATWKDPLAPDPNSANEAWIAWDKAGRPDTNIEVEGGYTTEQIEIKDAFKETVVGKNNIAIYQRSYDPDFGYGYYCYYYYWNRHNDNEFNGIMGPMEFAVVRNNVYKLAVTKINNLGHPRISENDPHKPGPGTPDEDESVYMEVTSEVIPWVVRVNNIEF